MSADDSPLKVYGRAKINIKFGQSWFSHSVLVADITNEGLIGIDFLMQHGITLDFANKTIRCKDETMEAQCQQIRERTCRIAVAEGVLIPPGTRQIVEEELQEPYSRRLVDGT